jgi:hypothetical protein
MAEQCHGCIVAGAVFQFVRLNSSAALLTNLRRGLECLYFIDIFRGIKLGLCSILSFLNSWMDGVASTNAVFYLSHSPHRHPQKKGGRPYLDGILTSIHMVCLDIDGLYPGQIWIRTIRHIPLSFKCLQSDNLMATFLEFSTVPQQKYQLN